MNATKKDFISLQLASDRRKTDALKKTSKAFSAPLPR